MLSRAVGLNGEQVLLKAVWVTRETGHPRIIYTISLRTKPSSYDARSKIFGEILKSFRLLPVR
jgi:hypothetical protein